MKGMAVPQMKLTWAFLSVLTLAAGVRAAPYFDTNDLVTVTCELAYYANDRGDGWKFIPPNSDPTNLAIKGVVLRIVEPKTYAGQFLTFHFDGPPSLQYTQFYEPGLLYQGQTRSDYIGRLVFMCDAGFGATELLTPLSQRTPEELRRLLQSRHWHDEYIVAIKKQFGDKVLFNVLCGFLTNKSISATRLNDQQRAASFLVKHQPACDVSVSKALRETLASWQETVSDWPLYLWRAFGHDRVVAALDNLGKGKLSAPEREKVELWRYWLSGDEQDLLSLSRR
jgi:hypothetical protein